MTVNQFILQAIAEKLGQPPDARPEDYADPAADSFADEMRAFYNDVRGTQEESVVQQVRDFAATIRRLRAGQARERKTA